jgi:hypothetical protein
MTKHATKAALLEDIRVQRSRLEKNLAGLNANEMMRAGAIGVWSIKDVLAHLMDWEQRFIGWYQAGLRGETPETPAPGLTWREMDLLNQRIYEQYRDVALEEIQAKYAASYGEILALLQGLPEEELFTPGRYAWLNGARLADWAAANTCNHYYWAKTQIRKSLRVPA